MLPPSLVSVYQQYKDDTNAVASWLASTAKSRGYPVDLLSGAASQATGPEQSKRLKGKARKESKAAAQQPQGSSSSSSNPNYIIAIKDFIPLAEFVAACKKPVVSVPMSFANTLNRVISTRSGFGSRLSELGDSPDVSDDSKHSYFVGVLEKVREVLTARFSPGSRGTASARSPSDPVGEVGGRFAGLSLEEPSEDFLNAPDIERPVPVKDGQANYVAEPPQDLNEVMFAYSLLFIDLSKILARIQWIWGNYREAGFELVAAAIATNTACDLARHLMEDMAPMFNAHGGAMKIARRFYLYQCLQNGFSLNDIPDSSTEFNCNTYEIADATYMVAIIMLESCLDVWDPDKLILFKEGSYETYDPTRDWSQMTKREKFEQDKILMMEFLAELTVIVRCVSNYPVHDEFLRGMLEFGRTRVVPMYLAFSAQVFLNINHILRDRVTSAYETCMSHLRLMDEDLALHMDSNGKFRANISTTDNKDMLKVLREKIKCVQDDPVHQVKLEMSSDAGVPCTTPIHTVLRYSPVMSGLMLYHFRATTYNLGLSLANKSGAITYPLHLYAALRQEELRSPHQGPAVSWEDMDVVVTLLGIDSFYVGSEPPKNADDYVKKLALQMGFSAAGLCNSARTCKRVFQTQKVLSKRGARLIKYDRAPIANMFVDRYVHNTGQVDWTPEHVKQIVSCGLWEEEEPEEDGILTLNLIKDPGKLRERKRNIAAKGAGKKEPAAASTHMPPEKLIRALAVALVPESGTMTFPYLKLHHVAWDILLKVRAACEPLLLELFGPTYFEDEGLLPWVVGEIFLKLAEGDDRLFVRAGDIVKEQ